MNYPGSLFLELPRFFWFGSTPGSIPTAACFTLEEIRHAVSTYKHNTIPRRAFSLEADSSNVHYESADDDVCGGPTRRATRRQYYMCPYPKLHKTESANFHSVKTEQRAPIPSKRGTKEICSHQSILPTLHYIAYSSSIGESGARWLQRSRRSGE